MVRWLGLLLSLSASFATAELPVVVRSSTHPAYQNDFESGTRPIAGRPIEDEAPTVALSLVPRDTGGQALLVTNTVPGGYVGLDLLPTPTAGSLVAGREIVVGKPIAPLVHRTLFTQLSFDYRADPRLKVNLIARVGHQDYELGFTGPPCDTGRTVWLGQAAGVAADGQWHHLDIPLAKLIQQQQPGREQLQLTELYLANLHQGDYLLAGFGGNQLGTRLELDNFELSHPGGAKASFQWEVASTDPVDGYAAVLDRGPETIPAETITTKEPGLSRQVDADGVWYLHLRAHGADGTWGAVTHFRFVVDTTPPRAGAPRPAEGAKACPAVWQCALHDAGSGVAPATLKVTVGDRALSVEDEALRYDAMAGQVEVDLARVGGTWREGSVVALSVSAADETGNQMTAPFKAGFVFTGADDQDPPERPELLVRAAGSDQAVPLPGEGTFEHGLDDWKPFGASGTKLERTKDTAAAGQYSLRLLCTANASPFSCFVRAHPFDAAQYRLVSFDYKIPDRLRVDFLLRLGDEYCRIKFTDQDEDGAQIGVVPDVIADNQWHHTEFNLYDMLRQRYPRRTDYVVGMLLLTGGPWSDAPKRFPGNYAGTEYFIDNFQLVPMLGADTQLVWRGADLTGVVGAEVLTAISPDQLPGPEARGVGRKVDGASLSLEHLNQGLVYLWARLYDRRGNRSRPVIARLLVDAGRPVISGFWPDNGAKAAPTTIGVKLRDDQGAGLDLGSLSLSVAGRDYRVDDQVLRYDAVNGRLIWDGRRAEPPLAFTDGQTVEVKLTDAHDQAGNRPKELPSWQFTMDYAADHQGPEVEIGSLTHPAHFIDGFESDVNEWQVRPAGAVIVTNTKLRDDDTKAMVIKVNKAAQRWAAWRKLPLVYAAYRFRLIAFEYRIPKGQQVDLLLSARNVKGEFVDRSIGLTGSAADDRLKQFDVTADGQWHLAVIPLYDILSSSQDFAMPFMVDAVGFGDRAGATQPGEIAIDNFVIFRQATAPLLSLYWKAYDETSVSGYSYVLDTEPRTVPKPETNTKETSLSLRQGTPGLSWFHLRAVDGAGNWGPPAHFLLSTPK